jgi:branched-chain amino acid aminotransferase
MPDLPTPAFIWFDGAVRPWSDARVHVWTEVVQRAASVFEGLRGYWNEDESRHYLVRVDEHVDRLADSAKVVRIPRIMAREEITTALGELVARLGYREDIYVRPTLYLERGRYTAGGTASDAGFFLPIFPSPREESISQGISCQVSSWLRSDDTAAPPRIKAAANYYNLRMARLEASMHGYDEAILLNRAGHVAETAGASVFVVRRGQVATPHTSESILESITRRGAIELLSENGTTTVERPVDRTELYVADEVFLTGTLCEITPVISVDGIQIGSGKPGPFTQALQTMYYRACQAGRNDTRGWLTPGPVLP